MIVAPRPKLKMPAHSRMPLFSRSKRFAVKWNGNPIRRLITIIPPIEPRPKIKIYPMATAGDGMVGTIKSINAALPARP